MKTKHLLFPKLIQRCGLGKGEQEDQTKKNFILSLSFWVLNQLSQGYLTLERFPIYSQPVGRSLELVPFGLFYTEEAYCVETQDCQNGKTVPHFHYDGNGFTSFLFSLTLVVNEAFRVILKRTVKKQLEVTAANENIHFKINFLFT